MGKKQELFHQSEKDLQKAVDKLVAFHGKNAEELSNKKLLMSAENFILTAALDQKTSSSTRQNKLLISAITQTQELLTEALRLDVSSERDVAEKQIGQSVLPLVKTYKKTIQEVQPVFSRLVEGMLKVSGAIMKLPVMQMYVSLGMDAFKIGERIAKHFGVTKKASQPKQQSLHRRMRDVLGTVDKHLNVVVPTSKKQLDNALEALERYIKKNDAELVGYNVQVASKKILKDISSLTSAESLSEKQYDVLTTAVIQAQKLLETRVDFRVQSDEEKEAQENREEMTIEDSPSTQTEQAFAQPIADFKQTIQKIEENFPVKSGLVANVLKGFGMFLGVISLGLLGTAVAAGVSLGPVSAPVVLPIVGAGVLTGSLGGLSFFAGKKAEPKSQNAALKESLGSLSDAVEASKTLVVGR